jgi:PAS domain S-box-containing protein
MGTEGTGGGTDLKGAPDAARARGTLGQVDLAALVHALPVVIYVAEPGPEGTWLYVSPQIEQVLGFTAEEWCAHPKPFGTFVHSDDLPRLLELEERLVHAPPGELFDEEYRIATKDGREVWLHGRGAVIEGSDGTRLMQGLMVDVTARRLAEDGLRAANQQLRALVAGSPLAVLTWDRDGRVLTWNPAAERIFGWTEQEAVGRFLPHVPEEEHDEMLECIKLCFAGETWSETDVVRRRKDGTLVDVSISTAALRDDGEVVAMMSLHADIGERKRNEARLREQEHRLRESERLDAVGRLAGGVAHDFNNLLTVIHGQAALVLAELGEDGEQGERVRTIVSASERASALTRQLLAVGRRQVLETQVLDLNEVVESVMPLLRRMVGEGIDLQALLADDVPPIEADPSQLDQVLVNLVSNAREAMAGGGTILLETGTEVRDTEEHGAEASLYAVLSVTDSGPGMDDAVRRQCFEPFFTTKEPGEGLGLGLATVYGVVSQSGGTVTLDSREGWGMTLSVHLPAAADAVTAPERPGNGRPEEVHASGETVLLVEDEPLVRGLLVRVLDREGYAVLEAGSGDEALALVAGHERPIDLLVSDVVMPGLTGPELAARIRERQGSLRVLFISGYNDTDAAGYGVLHPAVDLLAKPFTPDVFAARVRTVVGGASR